MSQAWKEGAGVLEEPKVQNAWELAGTLKHLSRVILGVGYGTNQHPEGGYPASRQVCPGPLPSAPPPSAKPHQYAEVLAAPTHLHRERQGCGAVSRHQNSMFKAIVPSVVFIYVPDANVQSGRDKKAICRPLPFPAWVLR